MAVARLDRPVESDRSRRSRVRRSFVARRLVPVGLGAAGAFVLMLGGLGAAAVSLGLAAAPAAAAGSTFTWSGGGGTADPLWSAGSNWSGGTAPGATVGSLVFPAASCTTGCATVQDLSVGTGSAAFQGTSIIAGATPSITLGIGSGGLSVSGTSTNVLLDVPVTLSTAQTWAMGGTGSTLGLAAPMSGPAGLTMQMGGSDLVDLAGSDDEVGPVSVVGVTAGDTGVNAVQNGAVQLESISGTPASLDATDGSTVTVQDAQFGGAGTVGPLAVTGGILVPGLITQAPGILDVAGAVSLDAASVVAVPVFGSGGTAGTDYGQVDATGAVALGGAVLDAIETGSGCTTAPPVGTTYTLVSASGGITGQFDSAPGTVLPDGGSVPIGVGSGCASTNEVLKVTYDTSASPATVTGTVEAASGAPSTGGSSTTLTASSTTLAASSTTVQTGESVTFTATVTPLPTSGTVTFTAAGCAAQAVVAIGSGVGRATCTTSFAAAGTYQVGASFSGNSAELGSSSSPVTVTVGAPSGQGSGTGPGQGPSGGQGTPPPITPPAANGSGYLQATRDGWVFAFGTARYFGSLPSDGVHVGNIVSVVRTPDGAGYWLASASGGVYAFGDARYFGSLPGDGIHVQDIVGMAVTPNGGGYWLVGAHGGIYAFGDAGYFGSVPGAGVHVGNVVGMAATPNGGGYWVVGADGGMYAFGDAGYFGSVPGAGVHVGNVVGMAAAPNGGGYWIAGGNGGVYAFGAARYAGSLPGMGVAVPDVVATAA